MPNSPLTRTSLLDLFRGLAHDVKIFLKEEIELVRRETTEKISRCTRNALTLVIGGFVAYAGLIVFLGGLGMLLALAFRKLGLDALAANVFGLGAVGLLVILIGVMIVFKGIKAFSSASLAPERTIATLKHLTGAPENKKPSAARKGDLSLRSPEQLQREVVAIEDHISRTLEEIAYRANPARTKHRAVESIRTHPTILGALAIAAEFAGSMLSGKSGA